MNDPFVRSSVVSGAESLAINAGLRAHMQKVFNYMASGLALTGAVAYAIANTALAGVFLNGIMMFVAVMVQLGLIFYLNSRLASMSAAKAQTLFWVFCGSMGITMASIFLVFAGEDIARAFFATAAMFAATSLWGYVTKRDLTGFGAFLAMGIMGLLIASLINLFLGSSGLQWVVSVLGVVIFTGLTAYDVQRIKYNYAQSWGEETNNKLAVMGALSLYLNFINAFQFMLQLMGGSRD